MPPRAAHRDFTGLYIVMALGGVVMSVITVVLFEAYRVGELSSWFASNSEPMASAAVVTNAAPIPAAPTETVARALPVDSNTPPPIVDLSTNVTTAPAVTNAPAAPEATVANVPGVSPRALPVDPSLLGASDNTNSAPVATAAVPEPIPPRALPVDPSELTNAPVATPAPPTETASSPVQVAPPAAPETTASASEPVAPRALPVDPSELTNGASAGPAPGTLVAMNGTLGTNGTDTTTAPSVTPAVPAPTTTSTARQSDSGPVVEPSLPPVEPSTEAAPVPVATPLPVPPTNQTAPPSDPAPQVAGEPDPNTDKRLVLTASQDSFVRVTNVDDPAAAKPLYAAVLHSGQSVAFDGRKFSINVGVPAAVDIKLDGVNYGPHDDKNEPETFTVESHLP